jgi:hypothetical protein
LQNDLAFFLNATCFNRFNKKTLQNDIAFWKMMLAQEKCYFPLTIFSHRGDPLTNSERDNSQTGWHQPDEPSTIFATIYSTVIVLLH